MASTPNLLLITVDCLRADHDGWAGYSVPTTPFLDQLATSCWRFEQAVAGGIPTYYSFPVIMASRSPLHQGRQAVGLAPHEISLARALQQAGYQTGAFVAANPYLSKRGHYHQGFDHFEDFLSANEAHGANPPPSWKSKAGAAVTRLAGIHPATRNLHQDLIFRLWARRRARNTPPMDELRRYPAADEVVDNALRWLENRSEAPFFLWLHFMDPHHPYYPPEASLQQIGRHDLGAREAHYLNAYWNRNDLSSQRLARHRDDLIGLYDGGIRWVDEHVGRLIRHLQTSEAWANTCFALTGDHGEEFLEHGGRYHYPVQLGPELTQVPLLLRSPGAATGQLTTPFGLIDLAPTLLGLLDQPIPESFLGKSWCTQTGGLQSPDRPVFTECVYDRRNPWSPGNESGARLLSARSDRYKVVVNFATGEETFFDLDRDQEELHPFPLSHNKSQSAALLQAMNDYLRTNRADLSSPEYLQLHLYRLAQSLRREAAGP